MVNLEQMIPSLKVQERHLFPNGFKKLFHVKVESKNKLFHLSSSIRKWLLRLKDLRTEIKDCFLPKSLFCH